VHRLAAAAVLGVLALGACRAGTLAIEPQPEVGDRARYRYEIDARVTSTLEGEAPATETIRTELVADQEVVAVTAEGVQADVTLRRDGAAPRQAQVTLDASGAIRAIELVEGIPSNVLGAAQLGALFPSVAIPPRRPLAPGDRWTIDEPPLRGEGRVARLGIVDGAEVAVVDTTFTQAVDEAVAAGTSLATLVGDLRSTRSTTYDVRDGALRSSTASSRGDVQATIQPPPGVQAAPALATITYEIAVRVTRLG
jgi:hypothetical protein